YDCSSHSLPANIDLDVRARLGAILWQVGGANGGIHGWCDSATADDVHLPAVEEDGKLVARDRLRLRHLESHETPLHTLKLLPLQRLLPRERRALVELHDKRQTRFVRRGGVIDVVAVERQAGLEAQRVTRAQSAG